MSMEHWWNETDSANLKYADRNCPKPLCPPQIQVTDLGPLQDRPTTDCLSHGTALPDDMNLHPHAYHLTPLGCQHIVSEQ